MEHWLHQRPRSIGLAAIALTVLKEHQMNNIDELLAIEQIKQLKARYCRTVDTKDWASCEALFASDFVGESGASTGKPSGWDLKDLGLGVIGAGQMKGGASWVERARKNIGENISLHHAMLPEIELISSTTARAVWAVHFGVRGVKGAPFRTMDGHGHYYDTYELIAARWIIKSMKLVIQSIETT